MNAILVPFMTHYLLSASGVLDLMNPAQAKGWFHAFGFSLYFCRSRRVLSGRRAGKYWTILSLSIVYCFGHLALAIGHTRMGLVVGLGLIALGAGGINHAYRPTWAISSGRRINIC